MISIVRKTFKSEFPLGTTRLPIFLESRQCTRDLASLTSQMLYDNDSLRETTENLKKQNNKPDEAEKMIKALLPTLDGFDRVLHLGRSHAQDEVMDNWLKSVESIYFRLLSTLENFGLYQMRVIGSKVDLNLHEVVEYRPSADHPNDVIVGERQKGYILRGKLLRDAKVVVAYNERSR